MRAYEVSVGAFKLHTFLPYRQSILPMNVYLSIDYIRVTLVSFPRYHRGYLQRLFYECPRQVEVGQYSLFMR